MHLGQEACIKHGTSESAPFHLMSIASTCGRLAVLTAPQNASCRRCASPCPLEPDRAGMGPVTRNSPLLGAFSFRKERLLWRCCRTQEANDKLEQDKAEAQKKMEAEAEAVRMALQISAQPSVPASEQPAQASGAASAAAADARPPAAAASTGDQVSNAHPSCSCHRHCRITQLEPAICMHAMSLLSLSNPSPGIIFRPM